MRFWDSSAIVPLLVDDERTDQTQTVLDHDPAMTVWWTSEVECASAIARLERSRSMSEAKASEALERLSRTVAGWNVIDPGVSIRRTARRLLRVHPLQAADALQLAAAISASEGDPSTLSFACMDDRLIEAARREGFTVVDPRAT